MAIAVPRAKYELLTDIRRPPGSSTILCSFISLLLAGLLLCAFFWDYIILYKHSQLSIYSKEYVDNYRLKHSQSPGDPDERINNVHIATWSHRATMYAESTKENENVDWHTNIETLLRNRDSQRKLVVCYYTTPTNLNASQELDPSSIDPRLCTHIIVGFANVINCTLNLGENVEFYKQVVALKNENPDLKVMISAGGMNEVLQGFPEMVLNHGNRKKFIRSVLNVTKILGLDGLDLDWEFPGWFSGDERQKIHFVQLVQELRKEFDRGERKLLLSIAVAAPQAIIDQSYNVPQLAEHVDFVNLMSYDYHFYVWYFPVTGLNAPLFARRAETGYFSTLNMNFSAHYWVAQGMPREKIIVGLASYGHSYTLDNPLNHDLESPVNGFGSLGSGGFVSYSEICRFLQNSTIVFNYESGVPYTYKNKEWISYDDTRSISYKAKWILSNGFGGAMILSLNEDDWSGTCTPNKTFILTRTVLQIFGRTE